MWAHGWNNDGMAEDSAEKMVAVSREYFEYNFVPWVGRQYESWLRASTLPHPVDPGGQLLIPDRVYEVFKAERIPQQRINKQQAAAIGARKLRALPAAPHN